MKPILIIQNCKAESAGIILDHFNREAIAYQVVHSYKNHQLPDVNSVEAVINLGCPISAYEYFNHDFLKNVYAYVSEIVRTDKPYLGICFGGQILAKVLGAQVVKNKVKEIGTYKIELTEDGINDPLFEGIANEFDAFHWHQDTFKIPFEAQHLASSKDCKNQAFRKNNAVGIQFHFEADIKEIPYWCDEYADELQEFGKTKDKIIETYQKKFESVKANNQIFINNFLSQL